MYWLAVGQTYIIWSFYTYAVDLPNGTFSLLYCSFMSFFFWLVAWRGCMVKSRWYLYSAAVQVLLGLMHYWVPAVSFESRLLTLGGGKYTWKPCSFCIHFLSKFCSDDIIIKLVFFIEYLSMGEFSDIIVILFIQCNSFLVTFVFKLLLLVMYRGAFLLLLGLLQLFALLQLLPSRMWLLLLFGQLG